MTGVLPTTESITKAIEASTEPNIAATEKIPGAYPLVYLNRMYTVAGTLTPDQANALAASVRYLATDGQDEVVERGGARLTAALQAEALAAADEIVVKNCTTAGYEVTTSGPSAFEPDTPAVQAMTSMSHCTAVVVPTTTTSATTTVAESTTTTAVADTTTSTSSSSTTTPSSTTTTVLVASQSPTASGSTNGGSTSYTPPPVYTPTVTQATVDDTSADADASTTVAADTTTTAPVVQEEAPQSSVVAAAQSGAGTRPRGIALSSLPMEAPDDGSAEFKKLGTLLLGAALFLLGRRIVHARTVSTVDGVTG